MDSEQDLEAALDGYEPRSFERGATVRPFVLKLILVLSMTVFVVDSQAEPVASADQPNDHGAQTEIVELDANQDAPVDIVQSVR